MLVVQQSTITSWPEPTYYIGVIAFAYGPKCCYCPITDPKKKKKKIAFSIQASLSLAIKRILTAFPLLRSLHSACFPFNSHYFQESLLIPPTLMLSDSSLMEL